MQEREFDRLIEHLRAGRGGDLEPWYSARDLAVPDLLGTRPRAGQRRSH